MLAVLVATALGAAQREAPVKVLATIGMIADVAQNVAGECAQVTQLMGPGVDPHLYQASARDVRALRDAELILYAGYSLEGQLGEVLDRFGQEKPTLAVAPASIDPAELITTQDVYGIDPHLWMDPSLWRRIAPTIAEAVAELAPSCAETLRANADAYGAQLDALHRWAGETLATIPPEQRILVTAHDAFEYYGRAYDLEVAGIQGISTESEAGVADIREMAALVAEREVPAVFVETTINPRTIQAVVDAAAERGRGAHRPRALLGRDGRARHGRRHLHRHDLREHRPHRERARRHAATAPVRAGGVGRTVGRPDRIRAVSDAVPDPSGNAPPGLHEPELAVHVEDLTVAYREKPVLWDIDLDVPPGVLAAIVGPNGAGKSTLIKTILGLVRPTAGHVTIHGRPYRDQRHRVGYVPQRSTVDWDFPTNALDVVTMGLYGQLGWLRRPGRHETERAREALAMVGMQDYAGRQISQLSGGQQQRVFLARALVQQADVYFLDEPMAGVDATTERAIVDILRELRDRGKTVIVVHHDLQTVTTYFDWLLLLNVRTIAQGPVGDVYTAENLHAAYGGQIALLGDGSGPGTGAAAESSAPS